MNLLISLEILFFIPAIFYFLIHLFLFFGIKRIKKGASDNKPFVSVIVAARNEERSIAELIKCLLNQTYDKYEIIIVNDRSTDNTKNIIASFQKKNSIIQLINIEMLHDDMPAKKNALRAGINASQGEILCFTDADCFPPPHWIEELIKQFEPEVGLTAGYSPYMLSNNQKYSNNYLYKFLLKFISYEEIRAAIWSSGSIGWNLGWLCTGRNLAYRKTVFDELSGFEKIKMSVSGDDDLFLQLVRRRTKRQIRYILNENNFVPTLPPINFRSFYEQRKRHFSAAKFFTFPLKSFFFSYHLSNLLLIISPLLFFINLLSLFTFTFIIIIKIISDILLYIRAQRIFKINITPFSFLFMELFYVLYNSIIGTLGILKKFEWKQARTK